MDMNFEFYNNILKDKDNIINYYVKQFGEENRILLEERLNKIKFFFYITPQSYYKHLRVEYTLLVCKKIQELLEKIGIDKNSLKIEYFGEFGLSGKDDSTTKILEIFWNSPTVCVDYGEDKITGIWCFLSDINMDLVDSYAKHRNTSPKKFLEKLRCNFFRNLELFSKELSDDEIIKESKYKELCQKYSKIADDWKEQLKTVKENLKDEYNLHNKLKEGCAEAAKSAVKEVILEDLMDLLSEDDKKKIIDDQLTDPLKLDIAAFLTGDEAISLLESFDEEHSKQLLDKDVSHNIKNNILKQRITYLKKKNALINVDEELQKKLITMKWSNIEEVKNYLPSSEEILRINKAREKIYEKYKVKFAKACFIDGNITTNEIGNKIIDLSNMMNSACTVTETEDGKEIKTIIYFDPYMTKSTHVDIHLRHEIRHALTTSVRLTRDNITEIKVGNKIELFKNDQNISIALSDYNEWVTQEEALKETKCAYEEGRYIITPKGSPFPEEKTSDYDYDLPTFKLLYDKLPEFAKKSQINTNNDSLYEAIELMDLKHIENQILQNTLSEDDIKSRLKVSYTTK